jgi:hypothetical protein
MNAVARGLPLPMGPSSGGSRVFSGRQLPLVDIRLRSSSDGVNNLRANSGSRRSVVPPVKQHRARSQRHRVAVGMWRSHRGKHLQKFCRNTRIWDTSTPQTVAREVNFHVVIIA